MANICDNIVIFHGENEDLINLYKFLETFGRKKIILNDIAEQLGFSKIYCCRGSITKFDTVDDLSNMEQFTVNIETARSPAYEFYNLISEHFNVFYASRAEEPGYSIYEIKNDDYEEFFSENYILDIFGDAKEFNLENNYELFEKKEELVKYLNKESGQVKTFKKWQEALQDTAIIKRYKRI